jgi:hypothetical protein
MPMLIMATLMRRTRSIISKVFSFFELVQKHGLDGVERFGH